MVLRAPREPEPLSPPRAQARSMSQRPSGCGARASAVASVFWGGWARSLPRPPNYVSLGLTAGKGPSPADPFLGFQRRLDLALELARGRSEPGRGRRTRSGAHARLLPLDLTPRSPEVCGAERAGSDSENLCAPAPRGAPSTLGASQHLGGRPAPRGHPASGSTAEGAATFITVLLFCLRQHVPSQDWGRTELLRL